MVLMRELTTAEMRALQGNANAELVDVRPVDAHNGWRFRDEPRDDIDDGPFAGIRLVFRF